MAKLSRKDAEEKARAAKIDISSLGAICDRQLAPQDNVLKWFFDEDPLEDWLHESLVQEIIRSKVPRKRIAQQQMWFDEETWDYVTRDGSWLSRRLNRERAFELSPLVICAVDGCLTQTTHGCLTQTTHGGRRSTLATSWCHTLTCLFGAIRDPAVAARAGILISASRRCGDHLARKPRGASPELAHRVEETAKEAASKELERLGADTLVCREDRDALPATPDLVDGQTIVFLDHVDGRRLWLHDIDSYCVAIGVAKFSAGTLQPIASVIYRPATQELCMGLRHEHDGKVSNAACRLNWQTYQADELNPWSGMSVRDAVFATHVSTADPQPTDRFVSRLMAGIPNIVDKIVMVGSGSLSLSMVAAGQIGCYVNNSSHFLKVIPGKLLIDIASAAANGSAVVSDNLGEPWTLDSPGALACGNRTLHEAYKSILRLVTD